MGHDECLSAGALASSLGSLTSSALDSEGSCCQEAVCAIPCPQTWIAKHDLQLTYGLPVFLSVVIVTIHGMHTARKVKGRAENFFVAGRSFPLWICAITLASQSLDSNSTLGSADLAYQYAYWDGAVLPIGLGLSLILNGIFIARHIHNDGGCLTLPDFYARQFGSAVEIMVSLITCVSFICLLSGNFVGMGRIFEFCFPGLGRTGSVFLCAFMIAIYTAGGGLYSVAYTDVIQITIGITGLAVATYWMLGHEEPDYPPPSIGFPGYIYPDQEICDKYGGVPGTYVADSCVYNEATYGAEGITDNAAYPYGDKKIYRQGMTDINAYEPFPNAILFNWATIFILGFGNLAALDFQARCMAAKTARIATMANFIAGFWTIVVAVPFALLAGLMRRYFGADSVYAEFRTDTCSEQLGFPSCAEWLPNEWAFQRMAANVFPVWLGIWSLCGIVAASMSTSDGAILAIATVMSHNVGRKLMNRYHYEVTEKRLLAIVRGAIIPVTLVAGLVASLYNQTGYLLVVAFDISLAGAVPPLFAAIYGKGIVTPGGALAGVLAGALCRVTLEFALNKDGSLVIPYGQNSYGYGTAETGLPQFIDVPEEQWWNPSSCDQKRLEDWTGLDSLLSPLINTLVMLLWSFVERKMRGGRTLWTFLPPSWFIPSDLDFGLDDREKDSDDGEGDENVLNKNIGRTSSMDVSNKTSNVLDNSLYPAVDDDLDSSKTALQKGIQMQAIVI